MHTATACGPAIPSAYREKMKERSRPLRHGSPIAATNRGECDQNGVSEPPDEAVASRMFANPHTVPTRLSVTDQPGRRAERASPSATAATTTPTLKKSSPHGSSTLTPYSERMYTTELSGMNAMAPIVETVVIATDRARSALMTEQSRPEKPPPGEVVVINSVIPATRSRSNARTTRKPRNGSSRNWHAMPVAIPRYSRTRRSKTAGVIVPAMPSTSPNKKMLDATARTDAMSIPAIPH